MEPTPGTRWRRTADSTFCHVPPHLALDRGQSVRRNSPVVSFAGSRLAGLYSHLHGAQSLQRGLLPLEAGPLHLPASRAGLVDVEDERPGDLVRIALRAAPALRLL